MYNVVPIPQCILEEIGLEGLDGITLEGLWKRLSIRLKLSLPLNSNFMNQVWCFVRGSTRLTFYVLAEERAELKVYDRAELVDPESGMPSEPIICPYNNYKYNPISKNGHLGSCEAYDTRNQIDNCEIKHLSLNEADETWKQRLVIVADQSIRSALLIPNTIDTSVVLSTLHYCVLERLGRARYNGCTTHGKHSLCDITRDPINFHYVKKTLTKNKLIVAQPFMQKIDGSNSTGQLLHLPRFFVEFKPKYILLTEKVIDILRAKPNCMSEYVHIKSHFDASLHDALRKLFKMTHFNKFVATDLLVPYRTIYPDAPPSEWKMKKKEEERILRACQLRDPQQEVGETWLNTNADDNDSDDGILGNSHEIFGTPLLKQAYDFIKSSGRKGVSGAEMGAYFGLGRLNSRTLIRNLERSKSIASYSCNEGRQKLQRYILPEFKNASADEHSDVEEIENAVENLPSSSGLFIIEGTSDKMNLEDEELESKLASMEAESTSKTPVGVIHVSDIEIKIEELEKTPCCLKNGRSNAHTKPLTSKMRHRYNLMLRAVHANGFISDTVKLYQMLLSEELNRGFTDRMCKKTFFRLLTRMCMKKQIRLWDIVFKYKSKFRQMMIITDRNIDISYAPVQTRIDQAKKKFLLSLNMECLNKNQIKENSKEKRQETPKFVKKPLSMLKRQLNYGNTPKFVRMRTLHEILYHLVYELDQNVNPIPKEVAMEHWKQSEIHFFDWDTLMAEEMSPIYSNEIGWKTFVQPIMPYHGYGRGWFLLNDLIFRLPLSVFVKICNINFEIPGLDELLSHPIKKHYLVNSVPYEIQQVLFSTRKYVGSMDDLLKRMCCMGLMQVGAHRFLTREQIYYYLNRKASLLNTISSSPGYWRISDREYPVVSYTLESADDIAHYWDDLYKICTNTKLNRKSLLVNEPPVNIHWNRNDKLLESLKEVSNDDVLARDNGELPGDHLGAAGLDSSFFAHLLRNWSFKTTKFKIKKATLIPNSRKGVPIRYNRLVRVTRDTSIRTGASDKKITVVPVSSLVRRRRRVTTRRATKTTRNRVTVYDDVDREALRRMCKLRVDWNSEEDNFLLLCRVAKLYLGMCVKRPLIVPSVLRDLMQWNCKSMNKTSQACKRRITYILKKPTIVQSMISCLEEVKQNPLIKRRFGPRFAERLQRLYQDEEQFSLAIVIHYVDLVYMLSKQYYNLTNSSELAPFNLPDSIDEFSRIYIEKTDNYQMETIHFDNPQTQDDVEIATIITLIHSTMCCSKDKTSWSIQLYEIYKDYPERLLAMAMKKVRSDQLISVNKLGEACHIGRVENRDLPLSAKPYHLSITYQHQMYTKISYDIFHEAFSKLKTMMLSIRTQRYPMNSLNGIACFVLSELLHKNTIENHIEIPKQVLILDPTKQTADNSSDRIYARFQEIFNYIPKFDLVDVDMPEEKPSEPLPPAPLPPPQQPGPSTSTSVDEIAAPPSTTCTLTKLSEENFHFFCIVNNIGQTKTTNRLALNEDERCPMNCVLRQKNPIAMIMKTISSNRELWRRLTVNNQCMDPLQEIIEVNETNILAIYEQLTGHETDSNSNQDLKRVLEMVEEILDEEQKQEDDGSLFASEIVLNNKSDIKKHWVGEMINEKIHKFHDFLFVNSCKLSLSGTDNQCSRGEQFVDDSVKSRDDILNRITLNAVIATKRGCDDDFPEAVESREFTLHEKSMGMEIFNFIQSQRELGATTETLKEKFVNKSLIIKVLNLLTELNLTIRTGIKSYTFVYWAYVQPWVVNTYHLKRLEREAIQPNNLKVMRVSGPSPSASKRYAVGNVDDDDDDDDEAPPLKQLKIIQRIGGDVVEDKVTTDKPSNRRTSRLTVGPNASLPLHLFPLNKRSFALKLAPWIRINGSLNRRVLDKWMGTILLYCVENAGLSVSKLSARFNFLLPVHIRDLLEWLEEYGCVELYVVLNRRPASLFSSYKEVSIERATYLDSFDEVIIEPAIDAVTKMAIFIGDKKYSTDFI